MNTFTIEKVKLIVDRVTFTRFQLSRSYYYCSVSTLLFLILSCEYLTET